MLLEDYKGNQLIDLVRLDEDSTLSRIAFALAAVFHNDQPLLVFNNWRQYWEIPGGGIDLGETALEAAHRELFEESGQKTTELKLQDSFLTYSSP